MVRPLLVLLSASVASAHFILNYPANGGFDEDVETTGPCGGFTPVVNGSSTEIPVDRFAVQITGGHPTGTWSFYATTKTEPPYDFTEIVPNITSVGLGDFCLTYLSAPSEFAGKSGVLQVVDDSVDGMLYQCAPVRFVSGSNDTLGSSCTNVTGFSATWASGAGDASSNTSAPSTTTSTAGAALATGMGSVLGLGLMLAGLVL